MFNIFMSGIFVFILGLFIGSFLNCFVYRLHEKEPFVTGRSFCPKCRHNLSWLDLVPVFSFLFLKGKCRYCQKKISIQYPLAELLTALIFFLVFTYYSINLFWLVITSFLIIIFIYDLKYFLIPDSVLFIAIFLTLFYLIISPVLIAGYLWAALGASGFFLAIYLISRGKWIGFGDVKLAILMGLLVGFPNILIALFSAFLLGAIVGLGLISLKKKTLKSEVPFGPFLIIGIYIALFFGDKIINWYMNMLTF
ncbi:prepilin peptidase [Patescibacteria group bacterium]|nr:prepilin peptidase [Patescibacteria group bacterium]